MDRYVSANAVFSKFSRDYMELKRDLPIRPSEMGVLNIITGGEGSFTPVMIAELLGVSKPMIAAHITALEEQGYILREPCVGDKRSFYVMPTKKALALVESSQIKLNEQLKMIEDRLGADRFDQLVELLCETENVLEGKGE